MSDDVRWHLDGGDDALKRVKVHEGRADLTNPQLIALAQAHGTLALAHATQELVEEQRTANRIAVLAAGASALDHDPGLRATTDATKKRLAWRNALREKVREALGL